MLRMKPMPESSEGAGDPRVLLVVAGVVVTRVAALVWDVFRVRLAGTGVTADGARVLLSHPGRWSTLR